MADIRAEVIRIEPPWGSVDRLADAYLIGGVSYTFHHMNLGKKGLTLNLKTVEGVNVFKELVKTADIGVQNFRPGTMERLGLGYEVLKELNPTIIYAALSALMVNIILTWAGLLPLLFFVITLSIFPNGVTSKEGNNLESIIRTWKSFRKKKN